MDCTFTQIPYKQTGYFSNLILDYLDQSPALKEFYQFSPNAEGVKKAIDNRKKIKTNRAVLVEELKKQYAAVKTSEKVQQNINSLLKENTFTVTTAHQPAIFTGTLYFIYKILHTIKLADQLNKENPNNHFVPLYWMGSEDADLEELGKIYLDNEKIVWDTKQQGAVGRMNTKGLDKIIQRIDGEFSVQPYGKELCELLRQSYLQSPDIQTATFRLLNSLFEQYGLIVVIPDNAAFKKLMLTVFKDDLLNQTASEIVDKTIAELEKNYKVQATPREINLFYLKDDIRCRIEKIDPGYNVIDTKVVFTEKELLKELDEHPERFSPNVILRGLFQETILPNIAFVGGGGEIAYWLEYKELFNHYKVHYPVLILRNSFLIVEKKWSEKIKRMGFEVKDFFKSERELLTLLVSRHRNGELKLENELAAATQLYHKLKDKAAVIDKSLQQHVEALQARAIRPLQELEKKLMRAEKRKYSDEQRQIHQIKEALFPLDGLQERIENFLPYYAKWGKEFMETLYQKSLTLEQEFGVLVE